MNPELLARARGLLAQASVIAEASSSRLDSEGSRGKPDSTIPKIGGTSTFDHFAQRLAGCRSDHSLEEVVTALESEIQTIRRRPLAPKVKFRMEVLFGVWVGHHSTAVARVTKTGERTIRRWREDAGFEPNYGDKTLERAA